MKMNKDELISVLAEKAGVTKKDSYNVLRAFIDTVEDEVVNGNKVQLTGFGTFEARERAARDGQNPRTGEKIKIAASKAPVFRAGRAFKEMLK